MPALLTRVARVAALVLLAWQAVLVQAHVHPGERGVAAPTVAGAHWFGGERRPDTPPPCPICREVAQAGHYLTPTPAGIAPPTATAQPRIAFTLSPLVLSRRSPDWRSRAPPFALHA